MPENEIDLFFLSIVKLTHYQIIKVVPCLYVKYMLLLHPFLPILYSNEIIKIPV